MNLNFLFFFIFYYFIDAIISTLHISSFIVVYIDIWHIVTACYVLMCFSLPLKSTFLASKNVSPPSFWSRRMKHHFVGNWIPYTVTYHFFNIWSLSSKNMQHKQKICKKYEFLKKKIWIAFQIFIFQKFEKPVCDALLLFISSILIYLWNCRRSVYINISVKYTLKAYIFYAIRFLYVFQKKSRNKLWMGTHAN